MNKSSVSLSLRRACLQTHPTFLFLLSGIFTQPNQQFKRTETSANIFFFFKQEESDTDEENMIIYTLNGDNIIVGWTTVQHSCTYIMFTPAQVIIHALGEREGKKKVT